MELVERLLSNEALDNLIQNTTCPQDLNILLQVKGRRIAEGQCEKIYISINFIYNTQTSIDLGTQILKISLRVASNSNIILSDTRSFCSNKLQLNQNENDIYYCLNLLNAILEYHKDEKIELTQWDITDFCNVALNIIIHNKSKKCGLFILTLLLPNYFTLCSQNDKNFLLTNLFKFIKQTKKLELLCVLFQYFVTSDFLKRDDFWLLIAECITSHHTYLQKQAIYLLSKSTAITFKDPSYNLPYLSIGNNSEVEKIWKNYLTLLDLSNEKQLHIIEPSLHLLNSVRQLHFLWRLCLYQILLNHSQNIVVYRVVNFVVKNERDWNDFSKIMKFVLFAVNKNEYSDDFITMFQEIGNFCADLDEKQFEEFLDEVVNVPWTPAAIWSLCNNVFNEAINLNISLHYFCKIIRKLKLIPHRFIRESCLNIFVKYFTRNYIVESVDGVLKISLTLYFNPILLENFIRGNKEKVLIFTNELHDKLQIFINNENSDYVEVITTIFEILQIKVSPNLDFKVYSHKTDLIFQILKNKIDSKNLEEYTIHRIESLKESEDTTTLINVVQTLSSTSLRKMASNIILEQKYNKTQKIVASLLLFTDGNQNCKSLIDFWKSIDRTNGYTSICNYSAQMLLQSLDNPCTVVEIEEAVALLRNILDTQTQATHTVLENITVILKHIDHDFVFDFVTLCMSEFLIIHKISDCKVTTNVFLKQLFQVQLFENLKFCHKILEFSQDLLNVSNTANSIAFILSERIRYLCQESPQKCLIFIPIIVKLILHGIVVNKNERVEYLVCQDISSTLATEDNPNFKEMAVRLLALETMLDLVESSGDESMADKFVSLLIEKYMEYFGKRYFPDSLVHLQKLRITQALLLLHKHVKSKREVLINLLIESFLSESHQTSVKHLMQWLLISLLKNGNDNFVQSINDKLKEISNNRPSTISGFIPVLYNLMIYQNLAQWDQVMEMLLPYTMGPQFKLRILSQVALTKVFEKAAEKKYVDFTNKYMFLYTSVKQVLAATSSTLYDTETLKNEFLDYINLEDCNCSTIFYTITKNNGVAVVEWGNLSHVSTLRQFRHISFNHTVVFDEIKPKTASIQPSYNENIQRKITPWKDILENPQQTETNDFVLVTTLIEKSTNLGGLSRTCEVFGIKRMVMRTAKVTSDKEFKSLSMSSENWVDVLEVKVEDLKSFILGIKKQGYDVVGAEQTSESIKLDAFRFAKRTVLVLGNEKEGIPPDLIPLLNHCIEIPQFGMVRSLNVHVAGAIVMWEYCKQQRL